MLDALKNFLKSLFEKTGVKIPDNQTADYEKALKEFVEKFEKENSFKEEEKKDEKPDMSKAIEELVKQITEMTGGKKPEEKKDITPAFDAEKLGAIFKATFQPIADAVAEIQKSNKELSEKYSNTEKAELNVKVQHILEKSWKAGKLSSAQLKDYKELLEKNFEVTSKVIELLPDNQIVAKQNAVKKFSLDGTAQPEIDKDKDKDKKEIVDPARSFTQTKWGGSVKPQNLDYVLSNTNN